MKRTSKYFTIAFILSLSSLSLGQDFMEKQRLSGEAAKKSAEFRSIAWKHYQNGEYANALTSYYSAIEQNKIILKLGVWYSPEYLLDSWIWVASCHIKMNNLHLALPAYRNSITWIQGHEKSYLWAPSSHLSAYAVALARSNKLNEAKICYYASLNYLRTTNHFNEPSPFLVVFDPDPKAEVWKLNKENLIKAAMCINAMENGFYREEFFEKYSDWDYAIQMKNAKFPGEKFNQENDPNIMRKNLQVLIKAEERSQEQTCQKSAKNTSIHTKIGKIICRSFQTPRLGRLVAACHSKTSCTETRAEKWI